MKEHLYNSLRPLCLSLAVLLSMPMLAEQVEIDGINYELNVEAKQATVIGKIGGKYSGEILIPESVEYEDVTFSVTSIRDQAFRGCSGLTSVAIGNSVTSIGYDAFYSCSGLTSVTIGNCVTSIRDNAFFGCSGMTSVTIGNSVTSIGNDAFSYCRGLTSVTIPNSVNSIGDYAFASCSGLTKITIGNGVTSIGDRAYGCSELLDVYCYAENVPSTGSDAFSSSPIQNATLHVSAASIESYKVTAPWSGFGKIVALTPEETGIGELKVENGKRETAVYDLSGRSVQKAQKGFFIQNGKVMVK